MKQALDDLLARLLEGTGLESGDLLRALLIVGLAFSLLHLLTMLVTRWGDSRPSTKAFVFSLLVHLTCVLGLVGFSPDKLGLAPKNEETEPPPMEIRDLVFEDSAQPPNRDSGNSPRFDRTTDPVEVEPERSETRPREEMRVEDPDRTAPRPEPENREFAEATFDPNELIDRPDTLRVASDDPRLDQPSVPKLQAPRAERREERSVETGARRNEIRDRGGIVPEVEKSLAERGSVLEESAEFKSPDQRIAMLEFDDPSALLKRGPIGDRIDLNSGPVPALDDVEIGTNTPNTAEAGPGGEPAPRKALSLQGTDDDRPSIGIDVEKGTVAGTTTLPPRETGIGPLATANLPSGLSDVPDRLSTPNVAPGELKDVVPVLPGRPRLDREKRAEIARRFGGSDETERAVTMALAWLAQTQEPAGYWDADQHGAGRVRYVLYDTQTGEEKPVSVSVARERYAANQRLPENERRIRVVDRGNAGGKADPGVTGLALLAFFGAGHTPFDGKYASTVSSAIDWLVSQQAEDGSLEGQSEKYAGAYAHAIATFALAEALNVHRDYLVPTAESAELERAVRAAVRFSQTRQSPADGGWRYGPYVRGQLSDTSIFGWQLMAMKSANRAGIEIPRRTEQLMVNFLDRGKLGKSGGLAAYRRGLPPTPSMTAEAQFCRQQFGRSKEHPQSLEAVAYLRKNLPNREEYDLYYWYYGTLVMRHHGGDGWTEWNDVVSDLLVLDQVRSGSEAGSWPPRSKWSGYGGRVYSTAMSALCLESYYRFFRRDGETAGRNR